MLNIRYITGYPETGLNVGLSFLESKLNLSVFPRKCSMVIVIIIYTAPMIYGIADSSILLLVTDRQRRIARFQDFHRTGALSV